MTSCLASIEKAERGEAGPSPPIPTPSVDHAKVSPPTTRSDMTLTNPVRVSLFSQASASIQATYKSCVSRWKRIWDPYHGIDVRVRKLGECPNGYPRLAAFLDSSDEFTVYRRFGWLQSRLLLRKQGELQKLEKNLGRADEAIEANCEEWLQKVSLSRPQEDLAIEQQSTLDAIEKKWCEYASLLTTAKELAALNKPSTADYRSVHNWMINKPRLSAPDKHWYLHHEDLITLRHGREHAWLDQGIERLLRYANCKTVRFFFCSKETKMKSDDPNEVFYDRPRVENIASLVIIIMILALLIVPIYILWHLINDIGSPRAYAICVGVLLISTLAFSAILALFTSARRHELLAAAAAYCAVLVVFYGNAKQA